MARIVIFQGGVAPHAPEVTPFRAPDFGPGIGGGLEKLGQAGSEAAQRVDEIQDVQAKVEANRLLIARSKLADNISQRVRSTLGEGAEAAADKGIADLQSGSDQILASASARAQRILEPLFKERNEGLRTDLWNYGFEQKKQAFDSSSQAANDTDLQDALHTPDDAGAKPYIDSIAQRNHQRATFFGLGSDWETQQNHAAVSSYHKGRALALGANSATDAINYAIRNRNSMTDEDFSGVLRAYRNESLDERAEIEALGYSDSGSPGTVTVSSAGGASVKTADPSMVFNGLIIPNEGSKLVAHDSNGAPVKYGINQKANPDVDVPNLTRAGAEKLFIDRYWNPSGADKLPAALAVVHADTYYLNEAEASKILKASGGDVQKYMELRASFLARLHASNPKKYPDYTSRNDRVEQYAVALGGDGTPFSFTGKVTDQTRMSAVQDEVMARKDIPLALKTRILSVVRERIDLLRSDKRASEEDARDALVAAATNLGDDFTSTKQLPGEALANASPEVVASLTKMAKTNREHKSDETLRPYVTTVEMTDPKKFMSKDFVTELMSKGASRQLISSVQTQQDDNLKKELAARPSVISSGELWTLAQPAFEGAGFDFDHIAPKSKNPAADRQANAQKKEAAIGFLHNMATEWALANPGMKPDEKTMRGWIGAALMKTSGGAPLFQANNAAIFNSMPVGARNTIIRALRRNGDQSTGKDLQDHVVDYMYEYRALGGR